jgi:hypothetical protein
MRGCFHDHDPKGELRGSLAVAGGDLETWFDLACLIHKAPFIFPFFAGGVEFDFPWLIKGLKPIIIVLVYALIGGYPSKDRKRINVPEVVGAVF